VIRLDNLAQVSAGIDAWIEACEELAEGCLRGMAVQAFNYILEGTPEWSGNLVASWKMTVGTPSVGYSETIFKETGGQLGANNESIYSRVTPNYEAIRYAKSIAAEALPFIRLGAPVYIVNNAPYAEEVEMNRMEGSGKPFLRPVNLVDGRVEMVRAAVEKFGAPGAITEATALAFAGAKL
jgi:hypothetical protein